MKVLAITQARTGSTRLPRKVLKTVQGKTLLEIHLERILRSKKIDKLIMATTIEKADDAIEEIADKLNISVYRGSVNNVLDRFYNAAKPFSPLWLVRLTSDCPLIDPALIDKVIDAAIEKNVDYCSNTLDPTFPDGMDIEVFKFSALEKAWKEAESVSDKEHVTPYIHRNSTFNKKDTFSSFNFLAEKNYGSVRLTVDEPKDFEVIKLLIEKIGLNKDWKTYADYYLSVPDIKHINEHIQRNEGFNKNSNNTSYDHEI